jgi:hypothetical protein
MIFFCNLDFFGVEIHADGQKMAEIRHLQQISACRKYKLSAFFSLQEGKCIEMNKICVK